jgi:hypothetical protein
MSEEQSDLEQLEQALAKQADDSPLDAVRQMRKSQLHQCAIKRSLEIDQLLNTNQSSEENT